MTNTEYLTTLAARLRYSPKTIQEAMLLKTHLLAEFMEDDMALNELIAKMKDDEVEARINEQNERQLDQFFETES
ncbi:hypothetical protein GEOBRER4_n1614 [Citrifermentans bremense]|uniref:Uncharacterized protein n=1 Tax=Citrifermentans bremense TaxID=60035 RepID=A0A6S6M0A4_9BACT|nr:hypothetical protein [Citrifermentans bremense]BCG46800.1 hypothetical protein GEOBRER4_n1614 [Citrifermentans bremense]